MIVCYIFNKEGAMRKEQVFLVDIYQLANLKKEVLFDDFGCEAGQISADKILIAKNVPALKFYNTYVPLGHMKNFIDYMQLKIKDKDTISYYDSRYLDEWIHIYSSYNQKIVKNIRPVFKEKGFISFSQIKKTFTSKHPEETIEKQ